MFAKNRKRSSLTLSQSNTGLCNIPNNTPPINNKRKSRKHKTKPNKRRHKKQHQHHQYAANIYGTTKPRSRSGPRLSQTKLLSIEDKEINAKKKKKTEFIVTRKNLRRIKENTQAKVSSKKKLFTKKHFKTPSLNTSIKPLDTTINNNNINAYVNNGLDEICEIISKPKPHSATLTSSTIAITKRNRNQKLKPNKAKRPRNKSTPKQTLYTKINIANANANANANARNDVKNTNQNKPSYNFRGKGRGRTKNRRNNHTYSDSHNVNLNLSNEIFKIERSRSLRHNKKVIKKKVRKKKKKASNSKPLKKNDRKITWMYDKYKEDISPNNNNNSAYACALQLDMDMDEKSSLLSVRSIGSIGSRSSSYGTDSDIELLGFAPVLKMDKFNECKKPTVRIVYSPRINEAVFIGYKPSGHGRHASKPSYTFRGKGKLMMENNNILNNNNNNETMIEKTPKQKPQFTFKHIKAKYRPHRIKWSTKTGFTDSEIDSEYENEYLGDNTPIFTFSDNELNYSNDSNEDASKTMKINQLLSNLFAHDSDSFDDEIDEMENNFTIVIDEIKKDKTGNHIYFGSVEPSENSQNSTHNHVVQSPPSDDDIHDINHVNEGELLFDFNSFVTNLSQKRLQLSD